MNVAEVTRGRADRVIAAAVNLGKLGAERWHLRGKHFAEWRPEQAIPVSTCRAAAADRWVASVGGIVGDVEAYPRAAVVVTLTGTGLVVIDLAFLESAVIELRVGQDWGTDVGV